MTADSLKQPDDEPHANQEVVHLQNLQARSDHDPCNERACLLELLSS